MVEPVTTIIGGLAAARSAIDFLKQMSMRLMTQRQQASRLPPRGMTSLIRLVMTVRWLLNLG